MKILFVGKFTWVYNENGEKYYRGGIERTNDSLLRSFSELSDELDYFVQYYGNSDPINDIEPSDELLREYKEAYNINKIQKATMRQISSFRSTINSNEYDLIVYSNHIRTNRRIMETISKANVPTIIFTHGPACTNYNLISDYFGGKSNLLVITSVPYEAGMIRNINSSINVVSIDYPTDYDPQDANFDDHKLSDGTCLVARWDYGKGIENAVGFANQTGLTPITCAGFKYEHRFYDIIEKNLSENNYDYIYRDRLRSDEVKDLLRKSSFMLFFPRIPEGGTLVIKESMILGTPVISYNKFDTDYLLDPESCIILREDDYTSEFIRDYLPNIDKYLSSENRKKVSEYASKRYTYSVFKDRLGKLVLEVLND